MVVYCGSAAFLFLYSAIEPTARFADPEGAVRETVLIHRLEEGN